MPDRTDDPIESNRPEVDDDRHVDLLVAYDSVLLGGVPLSADGHISSLGDDDELAEDYACLELLHRVWKATPTDSKATSDPKYSNNTPKQIGRFEVVRELGRGGYGIVLLAIDPHLDRYVAIKIPRPEVLVSEVLRDRFLREAEAAGRLDHPNLVPVFEVGEDGPLWYIASAFMPEGSLTDWLAARGEPLAPRAAALLVALLADAVQHAHSAGILHRDIKPDNVLMQSVGDAAESPSISSHAVLGFVPRLTDFGLAKLLDNDSEHTATGALLGTPAYMSPEQATGDVSSVGTAADVYGLGAILYELLTRRPPFRAATHLETLRLVVQEEVTPPRRLNRLVDRDLQAICTKCLQKQRDDRYRTARELALDLRRYLAGEPTEARTPSATERLSKWCRRKPALAGLIALAIVATSLLVSGLIYMNITIAKEARIAKEERRKSLNLHYSRDIQQAQQAIDRHEFGAAISILSQQIPPPGGEDRREFAWRFLWNSLHRQVAELPRHPAAVYCVTYSPDGKKLATAGADAKVRIWSLPSRQLLATLEDHTGEVNVVAFSPDGKLLATGGDDGQLILRETEQLQVRYRLYPEQAGEDESVAAAVFSPDSARLYVARKDHVAAWDTATGEHLLSEDHGQRIDDLALSSDGTLLAMVGGTVNILTAEWLEPLQLIAPYEEPISVACFLADGLEVLLGGRSNSRILVINALTGSREAHFGQSDVGGWHSLAISPDCSRLVAGGRDGSVLVFRVDSWQHLTSYPGHGDRVWDAKYSPDGQNFASAAGDGQVMIWRNPPAVPTTRADGTVMRGHMELDANFSAWSRDGKLTACASAGGVTIFDNQLGNEMRLPRNGNLSAAALAFTPDQTLLLVANLAQQIEIWEVASGRLLRTIPAPNNIRIMTISPQQDRLAIACANDDAPDTLILLEWPTARKIAELDLGRDAATMLSFAPCQEMLLVGRPTTLTTYSAKTLAKLNQIPCAVGQHIQDVAYFADGQRIVTAESEGGIAIRDLHSGRVLDHFQGHRGSVVNVAISPDERNLASASADGELRIWDLVTKQTMLQQGGTSPLPHGLFFNPEGTELAIVRRGSRIRIDIFSAGNRPTYQAVPSQPALSASWPKNLCGQRVHRAAVPHHARTIAWSPQSDRFIVATDRAQLFAFDSIDDKRPRRLPQQLDSPAVGLAFNAAGDQFLTVEASGHVSWWNDAGQSVGTFEIEPNPKQIALNPSKELLLYTNGEWLEVVNTKTRERKLHYPREVAKNIVATGWATDELVAVMSNNGAVGLISLETERFASSWKFPESPNSELAYPRKNSPLAVCRKGGISLFDPREGKQLDSIEGEEGELQWIGANKLLLKRFQQFDILDVTTRKVTATFPAIPSDSFVVSPDETKVAIIKGSDVVIVDVEVDGSRTGPGTTANTN